jgi:hypothetical protein
VPDGPKSVKDRYEVLDHGPKDGPWISRLGHVDKQVSRCEDDGENDIDRSQDGDWTKSRWVSKHLLISRSRTSETQRRHHGEGVVAT